MKVTTLVGSILLVVSGCGGSDDPRPVVETPAIEIATILVGDTAVAATYRAGGAVRAVRRAELATRMMARIETIRVRTGDRVRSGQVLATVEGGAVTAAGSQASAGLELATANHRRMERLYADSAVPLAQVEASRAALAQAQAQVEASTAEVGYTSIVAPFDGVIIGRHADPGGLAAPGHPILTIEGGGAREIVVGVPDPMARGLKPGQTLTALIGADRQVVSAVVAAVVPSADPVSRTVEVRLTTRSPLTPGLTAIVEIPADQIRSGELVVPRSAVLSRGELTGVYLVGADSIARLRWVRMGRSQGDDVAVVSGLIAGDRLVKDAALAHDGVRVRLAPAGRGAL
ncbi:MAG: efflux RND transporter periplasmic adaptor subunit [Gemmatimonadales bacterium]